MENYNYFAPHVAQDILLFSWLIEMNIGSVNIVSIESESSK